MAHRRHREANCKTTGGFAVNLNYNDMLSELKFQLFIICWVIIIFVIIQLIK